MPYQGTLSTNSQRSHHSPTADDQNAPTNAVGSKRKASPTHGDSSEDVATQPRRLRQKTCTAVVSAGHAAPSPLPTLRFSKAPPRPSSAPREAGKDRRRPLRTLSRAGVPPVTSRYVCTTTKDVVVHLCLLYTSLPHHRLLALGGNHDAGTLPDMCDLPEFTALLPAPAPLPSLTAPLVTAGTQCCSC